MHASATQVNATQRLHAMYWSSLHTSACIKSISSPLSLPISPSVSSMNETPSVIATFMSTLSGALYVGVNCCCYGIRSTSRGLQERSYIRHGRRWVILIAFSVIRHDLVYYCVTQSVIVFTLTLTERNKRCHNNADRGGLLSGSVYRWFFLLRRSAHRFPSAVSGDAQIGAHWKGIQRYRAGDWLIVMMMVMIMMTIMMVTMFMMIRSSLPTLLLSFSDHHFDVILNIKLPQVFSFRDYWISVFYVSLISTLSFITPCEIKCTDVFVNNQWL